MTLSTTTFEHVENRWDDDVADRLDPLGRLVYRSNLLGADWRITNTGGGNTSSKLQEKDPLTGRGVEVLWVKGSGGDLRTAGRANFASLYQDRLVALQDVYAGAGERGPKTAAEDAMVGMYGHCTYNLNPRAPSIDTPLHAFVPFKHVDHTHPVACIALATAANGPALTREIYGDDVIWVDWLRPGFELGLQLQDVCRQHPDAKGVILGGHGLINWADDDGECYLLSLALIDRAAAYLSERGADDYDFGGAKVAALPEAQRRAVLADLLPWLRGRISSEKRFIGTIQDDDAILNFVNSKDAERLAELGTSCPDHFLRTKIKPLYVDWHPEAGQFELDPEAGQFELDSRGGQIDRDLQAGQIDRNPQAAKIDGQAAHLDDLKKKLAAGLDKYGEDYAAYYQEHKHPDSPAIRVTNPTVVLIPGLGMIAWGKTKSESRVTAEFYTAAVGVMRGAEAVSTYTALPRQEAFDIEYWLLEEAKLQRMPSEKELSRRIVAVIGAGSGIGRAVVGRLVDEGAVVAAIDLSEEAAQETANEILDRVGMGIGVAGSGISNCGDTIALRSDMTDRASVASSLRQVTLAYGGLDHVVVTAGLYVSPDINGRIADRDWAKTFSVNVAGPFIVADEAARIWRAQGLSGSMVITTSVNATVPKKGSFAYDTSKAAANHLIRELAMELAPLVRVNGVAPATMVEGSGMFPRDRVIASLAKYGLPFDESDDSDTLRRRLADFYAERTLTGRPILPEHQSEAIFLLLGERLGRTTGQILTVDGGLSAAFLR